VYSEQERCLRQTAWEKETQHHSQGQVFVKKKSVLKKCRRERSQGPSGYSVCGGWNFQFLLYVFI
jgi:hypothetical protein